MPFLNPKPFVLFACSVFLHVSSVFGQAETLNDRGTDKGKPTEQETKIKVTLKTETGADTTLRVHPALFLLLRNERMRLSDWESSFKNMLQEQDSTLDPRERLQLSFSIAVATNNSDALQIILKEGPDVNKVHFTTKKETPLAYAIQQGEKYWRIVGLLLAEGADIMRVGATTSALHEAVKTDNERLFDTLLALASHTNVIDKKGRMPLWYAVERNQPTRVSKLMDKGADPNFKGPKMEGLLYAAFMSRSEDMIAWAMDNTLVDDQLMPNPMSPLVHQVTAYGSISWLKTLSERGLQVQELDIEGRNALFVLLEWNHPNRVEWAHLLIKEYGLSPHQSDAKQQTPALLAKQLKDKELTKVFKKYKK